MLVLFEQKAIGVGITCSMSVLPLANSSILSGCKKKIE